MPLPRPVWLLGWVSFFTDTASEMIYPLMPLFLTRVLGAGAMSLGVIEGVAEAANSVLKIVSGRMADRTGAPKPLVLAGYGLSSIVRPFIAMAGGWLQVLALRFADRLGKGIRSSPRDAMLATFATESNRGQIFGFHRAMDHAGAVMGPLIAAAFLYFRPDDYRTLFALTIVPGIIVILILLRIPDTRRDTVIEFQCPASGRPTLRHAGRQRIACPRAFWHAMALIFLFSLGNASDAFLLLRFADVGIAAFWIPLLWSAIHVVKTASSVIGGRMSDRLGRRQVIGIGWLLYAAVYAAFAITDSAPCAGCRLPRLRPVFRADRRSGEGVGGRPGAGGRARQCLRHLQRRDWLRGPRRQPAVRLHLDARVARRGVLTGAGFALAATALLYLTFSSDVATAGKPGSIQQ